MGNGDEEAYGGYPELWKWLKAREIPYVLAVACSAMIKTKAGAKRAAELARAVISGQAAASVSRWPPVRPTGQASRSRGGAAR